MTQAEAAPGSGEQAQALVRRHGYAAAALTLVPLPIAETVGVPAVHAAMALALGRHYGRTLDGEGAARLLARLGATVGASWLGTRVALGLAKLVVPGLPGLVGAPLVFATTLGLGAVLRAWFERGELDDEEVRAIYRAAVARARADFDPREARSPDASRLAREAGEGPAA